MADILHDLPIHATVDRIFEAISTPKGLDAWWTRSSKVEAVEDALYRLYFGPEHDWSARVVAFEAPRLFAFEMIEADGDWTGTRVEIELASRSAGTWLQFRHTGWPERNEHYRISCTCWAMYLRLLRRYLEYGEIVSYDERLDA